MKPARQMMVILLLAASPLLANAQAQSHGQSAQKPNSATTDMETGSATRAWLNEQAQGVNRAEIEPYRAESAGKAYRAYVDAIGSKDKESTESQLNSIVTK